MDNKTFIVSRWYSLCITILQALQLVFSYGGQDSPIQRAINMEEKSKGGQKLSSACVVALLFNAVCYSSFFTFPISGSLFFLMPCHLLQCLRLLTVFSLFLQSCIFLVLADAVFVFLHILVTFSSCNPPCSMSLLHVHVPSYPSLFCYLHFTVMFSVPCVFSYCPLWLTRAVTSWTSRKSLMC